MMNPGYATYYRSNKSYLCKIDGDGDGDAQNARLCSSEWWNVG